MPEKGRQLRAIQRHAVAGIPRAEELNSIHHRRRNPGSRINLGVRSCGFELHGGLKGRRSIFRHPDNTEQSRTNRDA